MPERKIEIIPRKTKLLRQAALVLTSPFFVQETSIVDENTAKLEELAGRGFATIALFTHFSFRDIPSVVKFGFQNPVLKDRYYLFPVALHQHNDRIQAAARILGIQNSNIVTDSTLEYASLNSEFQKKHASNLERSGAGLLIKYADNAVEIGKSGGVIWVAPQGSREPSLKSQTASVRLLANRFIRANVDAALIYLGIELIGQQDYSGRGLNLGRRYRIRRGRVDTVRELYEEANRTKKDINVLAMERLAQAAPPSYLCK